MVSALKLWARKINLFYLLIFNFDRKLFIINPLLEKILSAGALDGLIAKYFFAKHDNVGYIS